MKILHLSTSLTGGAGLAASRLAKYQAEQGHDVRVISAKQLISDFPSILKIKSRISSKSVTFVNQEITKQAYDLLTPISTNLLTLESILSYEPSVVHLHNFYNLISLKRFLEVGRLVPIVATMHDERIITGGCHITQGCTKFNTICCACPQTRLLKNAIKLSHESHKRAIQALENPLQIISPSQWLSSQIESANWTHKSINVSVISNMIEIESENLEKSSEENKFQVLIVAATSSPNKGLFDAIEALKVVAHRNPNRSYELVIIGSSSIKGDLLFSNLKIIALGVVQSSDVRILMKTAHLLLVASKSENSPNVIGEAQLAKLLVLASNVGGIPELVEDKVTGFLCQPNILDIANRISEISKMSDVEVQKISIRAYSIARDRHDPNTIYRKTMDVYQKSREASNR